MNILFLARATLYKVFGGDTIQILSTAKYLRKLGVTVDIKLAHEKIDYTKYDVLHLFNIIRPADFLYHIRKAGKPYVVSTIFLEYGEYQEKQGKGFMSVLSRYFNPDQIEYAKAVGRWVKNGEAINSWQYLLYGHKRSIHELASGASYLLPNSKSEYKRFINFYNAECPYKVIYNGVDPEIFPILSESDLLKPDAKSVICVSRIESRKNQLNLIRALNNTEFQLRIVGTAAPNHIDYYAECKKSAAQNIKFEDFIPQEDLYKWYQLSKVHVLPSWNETCGLSSLEAAYYNCNIVITDKGDTREYYGNNAWYCDPGNPESIYESVVRASRAPANQVFPEKIANLYNWRQAATQTLSVYEEVMNKIQK